MILDGPARPVPLRRPSSLPVARACSQPYRSDPATSGAGPRSGRPSRCGAKFTDQRWEETTARGGAWKAADLSVCGSCHADDVAAQEAAAQVARRQASAPSEPEDDHDQEPGKFRGLFRRRS